MNQPTVAGGTERFQKELGELEEIFTKIRDAIWFNTRVPDFSGIKKDEDVLVLFTVLRAVCRARIIEIIDQPSVDWKVIYQRANSLCDTIHEPRNLAALFYYRLSVEGLNSALALIPRLRNLIGHDFNTACTYGELLKRIKDHPTGSKIFRRVADDGKSEHEAFLEVLDGLRLGPKKKKIGKIKSHKSHKYSAEDLQQEAKVGAWAYWESVKSTIAKEIELPQSLIRLPAKRDALWRTLNPILVQAEGKAWADPLLPVLRGDWEKLPDKAHQTLKDFWEKQKAQKRDGIEWSYQEEATAEDAYSGEETEKRRKEAEKITQEWLRNAQNNLEERVDKIIQTARKHLGAKAAKAFEHRPQVDTDKEAAKFAGITEKTYRNYVKKLKKILDSNKDR
jgi:hypothetical protein